MHPWMGLGLLVLGVSPPPTQAEVLSFNYEVGRGIADITGPFDVPMWGYARPKQRVLGVHQRQWARAVIIATPEHTEERVVWVTLDLGAAFHEIQRAVVAELEVQFPGLYGLGNVLLAATHTHAGPAGFGHYGASNPLTGRFRPAYFRRIVDGTVASIVQAHHDLQPGAVWLQQGEVFGAGRNRSPSAYQRNPASERAQYRTDVDRTMTVLKVVTAEGPVAVLSWFAVHPTNMDFSNHFISGDNKGYAAFRFEEAMDSPPGAGHFVALFANANAGDVTPNLNLDATGPGSDPVASTQIIGQRQFDVAWKLFNSAAIRLKGPIRYRQTYLDLAWRTVGAQFTGHGVQTTCPSAYGYAFAGGSTEEGGGHFLFREGMKEQDRMWYVDLYTAYLSVWPSRKLRTCQQPKAILFATGEDHDPEPAWPQAIPLSLVQIGSFAVVVSPAEVTTMAGRRLRAAVGQVLGHDGKTLVLSGYTNDYAGYVTTYEEYQAQQYEGGHTLHGPFTEAAHRQAYTELAQALLNNTPAASDLPPPDLSGTVPHTEIPGYWFDRAPWRRRFGEVLREPPERVQRRETVSVLFQSAHPNRNYGPQPSRWIVERLGPHGWESQFTEADWSTRARWHPTSRWLGLSEAELTWQLDPSVRPGTYRVRHRGWARRWWGKMEAFEGVTKHFWVP